MPRKPQPAASDVAPQSEAAAAAAPHISNRSRRRMREAVDDVTALPLTLRTTHPDWPVVAYALDHVLLSPSASLVRSSLVDHFAVVSTVPHPHHQAQLAGFPRPLHRGLYGAAETEGLLAGVTTEKEEEEEDAVIEVLATGILDDIYSPGSPAGSGLVMLPNQSQSLASEPPAAPRLARSDAVCLGRLLHRLLREATAAWCYRHDVPRRLHEGSSSLNSQREGRHVIGAAALRAELSAQQALYHQMSSAGGGGDDEGNIAGGSGGLWCRLRRVGGCAGDLLGRSLGARPPDFLEVPSWPVVVALQDVEEAERVVLSASTSAPLVP